MPSLTTRGLGVALLLAATAISAQTVSAQTVAPSQVPLGGATTAPAPQEARLRQDIVEPVMKSVTELVRAGGDVAGGDVANIRPALREMFAALRAAAAAEMPEDTSLRVRVVRSLRAAALEELRAAALSDEVRVRVSTEFAAAAEAENEVLRAYLWQALICWCPRENWTRTLAGCPEGCADEQKGLIDRWIAAEYTGDEIVELMVAMPKGGERVRGYVKAEGLNLLSYLLPVIFVVLGLVVVAWFLGRSVKKTRSLRPGAPEAAVDVTASADSEWGDAIEKELKEMEG